MGHMLTGLNLSIFGQVSRHVVKKKTRPGKNVPHPALECVWESRNTLVNNFTNVRTASRPYRRVTLDL